MTDLESLAATETLFRDDAYLKDTRATVLAVTDQGVILDATNFYARGGGQPGDKGTLVTADGRVLEIVEAIYGDPRSLIVHRLAEGAVAPAVGETVRIALDWAVRHRRMRMHTGLHLLSVVLAYPVTGGSIGEDESRLDFDIPEAGLDREAIETRLNELIASDARVSDRWITDAELDANPGLVKTMSVQPPRGSGRIRLVEIAGLDLQPCGGTHVAATGEIGPLRISAIEKKGRQNRRVRVVFA